MPIVFNVWVDAGWVTSPGGVEDDSSGNQLSAGVTSNTDQVWHENLLSDWPEYLVNSLLSMYVTWGTPQFLLSANRDKWQVQGSLVATVITLATRVEHLQVLQATFQILDIDPPYIRCPRPLGCWRKSTCSTPGAVQVTGVIARLDEEVFSCDLKCSDVLSVSWSVFLFYKTMYLLFYVFICVPAWVDVYHMLAGARRGQRGCWVFWNWSCRPVSCHVDTGNKTQGLCKSIRLS